MTAGMKTDTLGMWSSASNKPPQEPLSYSTDCFVKKSMNQVSQRRIRHFIVAGELLDTACPLKGLTINVYYLKS